MYNYLRHSIVIVDFSVMPLLINRKQLTNHRLTLLRQSHDVLVYTTSAADFDKGVKT